MPSPQPERRTVTKRVMLSPAEVLELEGLLAKARRRARVNLTMSDLIRGGLGTFLRNQAAFLGALSVATHLHRMPAQDHRAALEFEREVGLALERAVRRPQRYRRTT